MRAIKRKIVSLWIVMLMTSICIGTFTNSVMAAQNTTSVEKIESVSDDGIEKNEVSQVRTTALEVIQLEEIEVPLSAGPNYFALQLLSIVMVLIVITAGTVVILQRRKTVK